MFYPVHIVDLTYVGFVILLIIIRNTWHQGEDMAYLELIYVQQTCSVCLPTGRIILSRQPTKKQHLQS
uniref:Uncharacterized protein n=1 Tax=Arundo donax TaxID=35708 RepID=A0A0A9FGQ6_ARUDO